MQLKKSVLIAAVLCFAMITGWELYWRSQGRETNIDDNTALYASQRALLKKPNNNQVVFIGSSRILFDIQKDIWREKTGTEPVMLAAQGASPLPALRDIVENTDFKGLIVVGVTPGLFFSTTFQQAPPMSRVQDRLDYFYKQTYAQRLNQWLSVPLQKNLVFITAADEAWDSDVDLKTLLYQIQIGERAGPYPAPFNQFEDVSLDRNVQMTARTTNDTAYANTIKKAWIDMISGGEMPPPDKDGVISYVIKYANQFKARGGQIVFVRCPADGFFEIEKEIAPRASFWDSLLIRSDSRGYHYEDYPQLQNLHLPESSHLSKEDADVFTTELIAIMQKDGLFTNTKPE